MNLTPSPTQTRWRMWSRRPIRKLRLGGFAGLGVALLLPLVNAALRKAGLPSVEADDLAALWDLGLVAYGGVAAVMTWLTAYLARPASDDMPVQEGLKQ
ncbi:MAG: hypothetical protein AAF624_15525 [Bacteroidota bacterium]